jgi:hypothetical protein
VSLHFWLLGKRKLRKRIENSRFFLAGRIFFFKIFNFVSVHYFRLFEMATRTCQVFLFLFFPFLATKRVLGF